VLHAPLPRFRHCIVFIVLMHLQLLAKLALWGLSRQELPPWLVTVKAGAMLRAVLPSLTVDNRWQVLL
jgi:hypothetical protein